MKVASCPRCGADVAHDADRCRYCGAPFAAPSAVADGAHDHAPASPVAPVAPPRPDAGEFGFGPSYLMTMLAVACVVFGAGWALEDKEYWLATVAVVVWAGVLPLALLLGAALWRARWGGILPGFAFGLVQLGVHTCLMWMARRHLQDDHVGIAAMFAGASLGGFLVGRALHELLRRMRARAGL